MVKLFRLTKFGRQLVDVALKEYSLPSIELDIGKGR